uniref:Uncharacterized protein n=1 Tax=Leersia perrieri TaxID=77586 RepID=A0A0D9WD96_9ORYZ
KKVTFPSLLSRQTPSLSLSARFPFLPHTPFGLHLRLAVVAQPPSRPTAIGQPCPLHPHPQPLRVSRRRHRRRPGPRRRHLQPGLAVAQPRLPSSILTPILARSTPLPSPPHPRHRLGLDPAGHTIHGAAVVAHPPLFGQYQ